MSDHKANQITVLHGGETTDFDGPVKIDAPAFYVSSIQAYGSSNDFTLMFSRPHPGVHTHDAKGFIAMEPTVCLHLSPQTLKDLAIMAKGLIDGYEAQYGPVVTEFSRSRQTAENASTST